MVELALGKVMISCCYMPDHEYHAHGVRIYHRNDVPSDLNIILLRLMMQIKPQFIELVNDPPK